MFVKLLLLIYSSVKDIKNKVKYNHRKMKGVYYGTREELHSDEN